MGPGERCCKPCRRSCNGNPPLSKKKGFAPANVLSGICSATLLRNLPGDSKPPHRYFEVYSTSSTASISVSDGRKSSRPQTSNAGWSSRQLPFFPDKTKYQKGGAPSRVNNINSMIRASYDTRETGHVEKSQGFHIVTYDSTPRVEGRGWGGRASIHTFWRLEFPIVHSYKLQALK